jgi:DNA-binding MarR family transcriptional regulator
MGRPAEFSRVFRRFMDIALQRSFQERARFAKAAGLSLPQLGILMRLHFCGRCGISEISERFDISAAAASQLVDKLVTGDLVRRSEDPADRRARLIRLSPRGQAMIRKAQAERHQWMDQLVAELPAQERARLAGALTALTEAAEKLEGWK